MKLLTALALWVTRLVVGVTALVTVWVALALTVTTYASWHLIGFLLWPFGRWVRVIGGRYLGCYPFIFALLLTIWLSALFHWAAVLENPLRTVARHCQEMLDRLARLDLGKIGGLWV